MKGNWPWILMVLANLIFWIALQQRNTTIVYYLTYNLDRKDLVPLINSGDDSDPVYHRYPLL